MTLSQRIYNIGPIARAILVVGAVAALVTGITFAQFDSTATLEDNTLSSETAGLLVDGSDGDSIPTESEAGFDFEGLVPGEESDKHRFLLRNSGEVDLDISVYATDSDVDGTINNNQVHFCFVHVDSDTEECYTRDEMLTNFNDLPGNPLTAESPDENEEYDVYVKVDEEHPGSGFDVDPFDLVFTGEQEEPDLET